MGLALCHAVSVDHSPTKQPWWVTAAMAIVTAAGMVVLVSELGAPDEAEAVQIAAGGLAGLAVGPLVHLIGHEVGHLVAAILLRLRVLDVRLFGISFTGRADDVAAHHAVIVDLFAPRRLVTVRMVLFAAAGPAANLVIAWLAYLVGRDPSQDIALRAGAAALGLFGVAYGLGNLLPYRSGSQHSDGLTVLRWSISSRDRLTELDHARTLTKLPASSGEDLVTQLRQAAVSALAAADGPATQHLLRELTERDDGTPDDLWAEADLMTRVSQVRGVEPDVVVQCCSPLSFELSLRCAHRLLTAGEQPTPAELATLVELAEAGHHAVRESVPATYALAMARGMEDRVRETRQLLVDLPLLGETERTIARVHAVRAFAEVDLGQKTLADQLIVKAEHHDPGELVVRLARAYLETSRLSRRR